MFTRKCWAMMHTREYGELSFAVQPIRMYCLWLVADNLTVRVGACLACHNLVLECDSCRHWCLLHTQVV